MLANAQLYETEIKRLSMKIWYDPDFIYYFGGTGQSAITLPETNKDQFCFVSLNSKQEVNGYISYFVDWEIKSAYGWQIINFNKKKESNQELVEFARDLHKAVSDCFEVYNMNKVSWFCYADNPAIRGYRNYIRKHGGRECGYERDEILLLDGKIHDLVRFEILKSEYKKMK